MGHLSKIDKLDFACYILAECDGYFHFALTKFLALDEFAQRNYCAPLVGYFDSNRVLARYGRDDAHT